MKSERKSSPKQNSEKRERNKKKSTFREGVDLALSAIGCKFTDGWIDREQYTQTKARTKITFLKDMNNDIEEIEAFLKPNKTKRRILIVVQTITIALSLLLSLYLFREIEYLEVRGND